MTDPFEQLAMPIEPQAPRPAFARSLRARLVEALGLDPAAAAPTVELPRRKPMSPSDAAPTTSPPATRPELVAVPYLAVHAGAEAIAWYTEAFGAVEAFRVVGDDGSIGHAELTIDGARIMLSDEAPAYGVLSPRSLGGTSATVHLTVTDVDALFARAVAAGATAQREPEDQPHGNRHGTLVDPFGHRWMLSQPIEQVSLDEYDERARAGGYRVERGPQPAEKGGGPGGRASDGGPYVDGIWGAVAYRDPDAAIRFVTEVLGFEEQVLVRDDDGRIVHSEYRWPEGGVVQVAGADPDNPYLPPVGESGFYVVTRDPLAVWERCRAAGVEVLREPYEPHYDPGGTSFSIRDPEGNSWSFGTYTGGTTG